MTRSRTVFLLALVALDGCGGSSTANAPQILGRSFGAEPAPVSQAPAPSGDPAQERNGTVPKSQAAGENKPAPGTAAASPQAVLRRYALAYINWQATSLPAHERALASLAIGPARLVAEQTAASQSATASLVAHHVENKGVVLAITAGQGPARGQWVVVTQEQTTGTGPYAGLPPTPHVTFARAKRLGRGWFVSEWSPGS
jgi:hypothetical protein